MTRARELARLGNENVLSVEDDSLEVGINSTKPTSALDVAGQLNVGTTIKAGVAGVLTASQFSGNITGTSVTFTDGTFTGNVTIGGTLTYEDVTNIDSLGIVTARAGVNVSGGELLVGSNIKLGNAGIVTSQGLRLADNKQIKFGTGDDSGMYYTGSHLYIDNNTAGDTYLRSTNINLQTNSASSSENAIVATANAGVAVYYNGTEKLSTTKDGTVTTGIATATNAEMAGGNLTFMQQNNGHNTVNGSLIFSNAGTSQVSRITGYTGSSADDGDIRFYTKNSGTETEALRISQHATPKLQLLAGESEIVPSASDGSLTFRADPGQNRNSSNITFEVDNTDALIINSDQEVLPQSHLRIKDSKALYLGDSNDFTLTHDATDCRIRYNHSVGVLKFQLNDNTTVGTFDASGRLLLGATAARDVGGLSSQKLVIEGTDGPSSALSLIDNQNSAGGSPSLSFAKTRGTSVGSNTIVQDGDSLGSIVWCAADGNDIANQSAKITCTVDAAPGSNDTAGRLKFLTSEDGSSSPTSRLEINKDGHVYVKTGSIVMSTSGQGIDFSATSDGGGMTGELLDDYEKGDFTATCANSVTLQGSSDQLAYVKVGNLCHVQGQLQINSSNSSSDFKITNLPFAATNPTDSGGHSVGAVRLYGIDAPSGIGPFCIVYDGLTELQFRMSRDNTTDTAINATDGGYFAFSITYRTVAT